MNRLAVMALLTLLAPLVQAGGRYALVIGANHGHAAEIPLQFADKDAKKIAETLSFHGKFPEENVVVLGSPNADDVRGALAKMNARIRSEACDSTDGCAGVVFVVFYSGHADALALHLGATSLPWEELRDLVKGSPADLRLLVVDACRSGSATRVKGFKQSKPFALPPEASQVEGFVVLSSAAAGEEAQESDELRGSFFTHHFLAALRGAADANGDSKVSLQEAYRYTSERTIASTAATLAGIQHPTFNFEMSGKAQLVLTWLKPDRELAALVLPKPGVYLLHRGKNADAPLEIEAHVPGDPRTVWLPPGEYFVRWRTPENLREGELKLAAAAVQTLQTKELDEVDYAELVRKGIIKRQGWESDEIPSFRNAYTLRDSEWEVGFARLTGVGIADRFQLSTSLITNFVGMVNLNVKWNFLRSAHLAMAVQLGGGFWFMDKTWSGSGELITTVPVAHRLLLSAFAGYGFAVERKEEEVDQDFILTTVSEDGLFFGVEVELIMNPSNLLIWRIQSRYSFLHDRMDPVQGIFGWAHRWDTFRIMVGVAFSTQNIDLLGVETPVMPIADFWWRW